MHELSLVQHIFTSLEGELIAEESAKLSVVELKIGRLANVEPILLQNAFSAFQAVHPRYAAVSLRTELVEIRVHCSACEQESEVQNYSFQCQHCGRPTRDIIAGEELLIHRIHFAERESVP